MSQRHLSSLLDRIRTICKECQMETMPMRFTTHEDTEMLESYAKAIEKIHSQVLRVHQMDREYANLQGMLQRYETELRRRAGIENQLRLQLQVCKQQLDELQNEKLELLDNTKNYIKDLKKVNEQLFEQLANEANKSRQKLAEAQKQPKKLLRQKPEESSKLFYRAKPKREQSIKQITKTQYIERQHNLIELKKNRRMNNFKAHRSIMTEMEEQKPPTDDNFHTFQDTNIPNTQRKLKKANKSIAKGISHKDKSKDQDVKSPHRGNAVLLKNRMELMTKHISRNRKHNRSIYSVLSAENSHNQLDFQ